MPKKQSASYSYQGANLDFRLTDITNFKTGTTVLSKFDYTYNANGTLASWQQQTDSSSPTTWNYLYDKADQLLSAIKTNSVQAVVAQYVYGYDLAGNRTSEQNGLSVKATVYNNPVNKITSISGGGPLQFTGGLSEPSQVTVGGNPAKVDATNHFTGSANVVTGTNVVSVIANDYSGNFSTNKYQVVVPANASATPVYDLNGNLIDNGAGQTYEWDAKDELTAINYTGGAVMNGITRTECTYDGLSRRVKIVEKTGSMVTTTKQFVWVGNRMAEERDGNGNVTKRFFGLGEQISGTSYYLTRDHLGSIRELTTSAGVIQARYDYDPYGRVSPVGTITVPSDFQYAGMYLHANSTLNLTKYRAYDPNTGRWLNRDPIAERGGINLYRYVGNDPINMIDPLGLTTIAFGGYGSVNFGFIADISIQVSLSWNPAALGDLSQWRIGYVFSGAPPFLGASSGIGASAGVKGTYSTANCPEQFNGWSGTAGGSGGLAIVGGGDIGNIGTSGAPLTYNGTLGVGAEDSPELSFTPAEGHTTASWTHAGSFGL